MDRPISSLLGQDLVTVHSNDSLEQVERVLDAHDVTYVPVVDSQGAVFGIITAHDLLHFHAMKKNAKAHHAWEICTHRPLEVDAGTMVSEVARLMVEKEIHHVLVTNNGSLAGVVTPIDLVAKFLLADSDVSAAVPKHKDILKEHSASVPNGYAY